MQRTHRFLIVFAAALSLIAMDCAAEEQRGTKVFGEFVGSSPVTEPIKNMLAVPPDAVPPIQWKIRLYQDPGTREPTVYELSCSFYVGAPEDPMSPQQSLMIERDGRWKFAKGAKHDPEAVVYELDGAVSLFELNANIVHLLNSDGSLIVGTSGWSFTLNRADAAEAPGSPPPPPATPPESYRIQPLETGPGVFGVFVGRTPYEGIARHLKRDPTARGTKLKWVVTLFQDSVTQRPTTYRIEGTLFRRNIREGRWSITQGTTTDPDAIVYELEPTSSQAKLSLLKGDDNVLFFLDGNRGPFVGHADFSYTLNRVQASD